MGESILVPTILCGGAGSRLWPVSRQLHPKPFIRLAGGPIPHEIIDQTRREAVAHMPNEWGGAICWTPERGYWLEQPEMIHQSAGRVSYRNTINEDERVIDIHSHGALPAYFSSTDDKDDREAGGVYLAAVIGKANPVDCCAVSEMNNVIRAVINGQLIGIAGESRPWEKVPATEGVAE